jgi:protoporphyrinogen oxidase
VNQEYESVPFRANNFWEGRWITHPVQCNLHALPHDLAARIIVDFVETAMAEDQVRTYADWLYASYGRTFAETFPMVYGQKYHTTTADNMTTDWLGPRMYRPSLEEIVAGALEPPTAEVHYVTHFRYPSHGGFLSYVRPLAAASDVRLSYELDRLDPVERTLSFTNGRVLPFEHVVSSIPLPELIPRIVGAPADVLDAARRLSFTTAVIVNVGVDRADLSEAHLSYFYDPEIVFSRLNFPHMLSPHTVPPGAGAIQAEIYFSDRYRPLTVPPASLVDRAVEDMRRCGVLRESDRILLAEARAVRYANVIFDLDRADALATVHGYLDDVGVRFCGRYGDWDHAWTDEAFMSGERAATEALDGMGATAGQVGEA